MAKLILGFVFLALCACSHGPCNNLPQKDKAALEAASSPAPKTETETILVYKETGELQCGQKAGTPIEKTRELLVKNNIPVFDSKTQDDGMMRVQVCGAPTGQIHVFTVPKAQAKRALGLGFKAFKGNQ